jgi:hypothetical protein
VVEDLHVRGMLANHRLARHVADAARNLAEYGKQHLAASGADSNGHGAGRKTPSGVQVAVKLGAPPACGGQPGTRQRGQTGTVPTQDGTAVKELTHAS